MAGSYCPTKTSSKTFCISVSPSFSSPMVRYIPLTTYCLLRLKSLDQFTENKGWIEAVTSQRDCLQAHQLHVFCCFLRQEIYLGCENTKALIFLTFIGKWISDSGKCCQLFNLFGFFHPHSCESFTVLLSRLWKCIIYVEQGADTLRQLFLQST